MTPAQVEQWIDQAKASPLTTEQIIYELADTITVNIIYLESRKARGLFDTLDARLMERLQAMAKAIHLLREEAG